MKYLIGAYLLGVMFFGGLMGMWFFFDWLSAKNNSPIYHVVAFFVSVGVFGIYEWYALVLLDWIAEKLDL